MRNIIFIAVLFLTSPYVMAANFVPGHNFQTGNSFVNADRTDPSVGPLLLFAENENEQDAKPEQPEPGSLVIPGEDTEQADKKCLTVCKQWGEDCIINPRTGARNCRRTCKNFGKECF